VAERIHVVQVGAPDPELHNSPVVEETAEEYETAAQALPDQPQCYFNGCRYPQDQLVCSGSELLRCGRGVWIQAGSCDNTNP